MRLPGKPTGSPDRIHGAADACRSLARGLSGIDDSITNLSQRDLSSWTGTSKNSFEQHRKLLSTGISDFQVSLLRAARELDTYADHLRLAQDAYNAAAGVAVVATGAALVTFGASLVVDGTAAAALSAALAALAGAADAVVAGVSSVAVELSLLALRFPQVTVAVASAATVAGMDALDGASAGQTLEDAGAVFVFAGVEGWAAGGRGSASRGAEGEDFASQAKYDGYAERLSAKGSTPKSFEEWERSSQQVAQNRAAGNALRDEVTRRQQESGGDWVNEYSPPGSRRFLDVASVEGKIGIEVKSGSTPTKEGLIQLSKDEELVRQGWQIQWQLKQPLSKALMDQLEFLSSKYPNDFTWKLI